MQSVGEHIDKYGFVRPAAVPCSAAQVHTENARLEKWNQMLQDWSRFLHTKTLKRRIQFLIVRQRGLLLRARPDLVDTAQKLYGTNCRDDIDQSSTNA